MSLIALVIITVATLDVVIVFVLGSVSKFSMDLNLQGYFLIDLPFFDLCTEFTFLGK